MARVGVLLVDPDQTLVGGVRQSLEGHPYELRLAGSAAHALEVIGAGDAEAVLVSLGAVEHGSGALITDLAGRWPDLPVVAVTEPGGRAQGFQALGAGAWDYLEPPGDLVPERLLTVIAGALERRRLRRELRAHGASETLNLEARERQAILAALDATRWNKQAAARLLGLHRPTLYAKMRKHGIPQARPQ
jgi:two-component system, response regulator RegA